MKEIVERLTENRNIERAKSILESAGYQVSKDDSWDDIGSQDLPPHIAAKCTPEKSHVKAQANMAKRRALKPKTESVNESDEGSEKLPGFKCFVGGKGAYYDDFAGACKLPGDGNIYGVHVDTEGGGDIAICIGGDEEFATKDNNSDRIMVSACCYSDAESYDGPENCWILQMGGAEDLEDAFEIGRSLLSTAKSRGISGINSLCKRLGFEDVMDY